MRITEIFQEDTGKLSWVRFQSLIALVVSIILTFQAASYEFILTWLVIAVAPKAFQKLVEEKIKK